MRPEWIIIDGYELMFRGLTRDCGLKAGRDERARADLSAFLARYAACEQCRLTIVFEGDDRTARLPAQSKVGAAEVVLTRDGRKAWKEIERLAASSPNPNGALLVASHPALRDLGARVGCRLVEPRQFFLQVIETLEAEGGATPGEPPEKYSPSPERADIEMWKRVFSSPQRNPKDRKT